VPLALTGWFRAAAANERWFGQPYEKHQTKAQHTQCIENVIERNLHALSGDDAVDVGGVLLHVAAGGGDAAAYLRVVGRDELREIGVIDRAAANPEIGDDGYRETR